MIWRRGEQREQTSELLSRQFRLRVFSAILEKADETQLILIFINPRSLLPLHPRPTRERLVQTCRGRRARRSLGGGKEENVEEQAWKWATVTLCVSFDRGEVERGQRRSGRLSGISRRIRNLVE